MVFFERKVEGEWELTKQMNQRIILYRKVVGANQASESMDHSTYKGGVRNSSRLLVLVLFEETASDPNFNMKNYKTKNPEECHTITEKQLQLLKWL